MVEVVAAAVLMTMVVVHAKQSVPQSKHLRFGRGAKSRTHH